MLTKKQHELLLFIHESMKETDISPSFEEMKDALGLKSKSGIHRLIGALVERGYIERLPNRARALRVVSLPDGVETPSANENTDNFPDAMHVTSNAALAIPLYGQIAAGTPIEAIATEQNMVDVPMGFLGSSECYALEIEGDSMMKAGIMDGDIVLIERCNTASDGDIIVALVDGEEATLKRLRREIGKVILQPENDSYQPIMLDAARVQIQGKLKTLYRHY